MRNGPIQDCGYAAERLPEPLLLEAIRVAIAAGILAAMLCASPAFWG